MSISFQVCLTFLTKIYAALYINFTYKYIHINIQLYSEYTDTDKTYVQTNIYR